MRLGAIRRGPRTTTRAPDHKVYRYLLRGLRVVRRDRVWSTDVTYIPLDRGFMYLAVVIDWHSRFALSWRLSNTLDGRSCLEALDAAPEGGRPEFFNTDQGVQFTAKAFTGRLEAAGLQPKPLVIPRTRRQDYRERVRDPAIERQMRLS